MEWLKLGLLGLPDAEMRLVATLFRLHQVEPSFIWRLSEAQPYDAVLADARVSDEALAAVCGSRTQVKRLALHGTSDPDQLSRPLRSDRLVNWLNAIEVTLLHGSGDHFASTAAPSRIGHSRPAMSLGSVSTVAAASSEWLTKLADESVAVKLARWPSATLLGKDVGRIRIATMISRRPMCVQEVASMARVPRALCQGFLASLGESGYLQTSAAPPAAPPESPAGIAASDARDTPAAKKGRMGFGASLISSIRKRFGIV
ncbi:hypothetical protein [Hydrogenophaga sp. 5NK40-0174]|uniref:hypothetical protein n=1 Tax=Hydrogenophaga sp. 5NK40-0174 TaxID=3127649 RepID=UPI0031051242